MLCGPVVSLSVPGYEHYALNEQSLQDIGGAGFGYSDSPEALDVIREGYRLSVTLFWPKGDFWKPSLIISCF
jgi:hypothetical protein